MTEECFQATRDSLLAVCEKGRKAVVRNEGRRKFVKVKVDGCLIRNRTAADWVISLKGVGDVVIELKGGDVDRAVEQVADTIQFFGDQGYRNGVIAALVVCSRYPKVDTKVQRAKYFLAKKFRAPLHVVTQNLEFDFEALLSLRGPFRTG